jgi:hypothetical protein
MLERSMPEPIIGGALVGIFEDFVGLVDFLETVFRGVVVRIAIRMKLHRLFAKGGLDLAIAGGAFNFQGFVIAALSHPSVLTRSMPRIQERAPPFGFCGSAIPMTATASNALVD